MLVAICYKCYNLINVLIMNACWYNGQQIIKYKTVMVISIL